MDKDEFDRILDLLDTPPKPVVCDECNQTILEPILYYKNPKQVSVLCPSCYFNVLEDIWERTHNSEETNNEKN